MNLKEELQKLSSRHEFRNSRSRYKISDVLRKEFCFYFRIFILAEIKRTGIIIYIPVYTVEESRLADCESSGCIYINADPVISSVLADEGFEKYMFNQFHPNAPDGIGLFSYAVLKAAHDQGI